LAGYPGYRRGCRLGDDENDALMGQLSILTPFDSPFLIARIGDDQQPVHKGQSLRVNRRAH
jgi:hypothetical protein